MTPDLSGGQSWLALIFHLEGKEPDMATFKLMFVLWIATLVLVCCAGTARAQARDGGSTGYSYSCSGMGCFGGNDDADESGMVDFFEFNLRLDRQYGLVAYPSDYKKLKRSGSYQLGLTYGWDTTPDTFKTLTLWLGHHGVSGTVDGAEHEVSSGTVGLGFNYGQYLADRLMLTEGGTILFSSDSGLGAQFDIMASVYMFKFLGMRFTAEAGLTAGLYRTGLENQDGTQVNMLGIGPAGYLTVEVWRKKQAKKRSNEE